MSDRDKPRPAGQLPPASSMLQTVGDAVAGARDDVERAVEDVMRYLASPRGRELRGRLSMGLIALAPVIVRSPALKRHPVFRFLGVAGAGAVLVKIGEAIRDWEPGGVSEPE